MKGSSSSSCCPGPSKPKREDLDLSANDRISLLPRPILHHILSFLETKDVVPIGILSKTWYQTSTSFAISDFCQTLVGNPRGLFTKEERFHMFVEFVRKSLLSQCRIYGTIPKFKLSMIHHSRHTTTVEDCIQLAIQNNVKELDIKLRQNKGRAIQKITRAIMPQTLLSAKELIQLSLSECHLSPPPTHGLPTWPFLRTLCLDHCHVDGQIFQNLNFSCPLLESLFLIYCDELPDISLSGLTKLTEVDISRKSEDDLDIMVKLDVPSLETFTLYIDGACNVDLTACKNITVLKWDYSSPMFSSKDLTNLIAGLPALQSLELCCKFDRIRFSSQRLEKLQLTTGHRLVETDLPELIAGLPALKSLSLQCFLERIKFSSQQLEELHLLVSDVVEVRIDAPSLKKFTCICMLLPSDFIMGRSIPQEVTITILSESPSFLQLRKILGGFNQIKLLRLSILLPTKFMDIPLLPALPKIEHLRILPRCYRKVPARGEYVALLKGLLWSCRPESISVSFRHNGKFMTKVFCEELSEMVKGQYCCTDDDDIQCGCHGLRSFQINQFGGYADGSIIGCDALLELLPTLVSEDEIHFMLEWCCACLLEKATNCRKKCGHSNELRKKKPFDSKLEMI